jgi:hypothetical protein
VSGLKNDAEVGSDVKGLTGIAVAVTVPLSVTTMRIYSKVTANSQHDIAGAGNVPCRPQVFHLLEIPAPLYCIPNEMHARTVLSQPLPICVFWLQL